MQPEQNSGQNPNYDFIMNSGQKPKKSLVPNLGLPKAVIISLAAAVVLVVVIILASLIFGGNKSGSTSIASVIGKAQEISRVSSVAAEASSDSGVDSLSTTVITVLNSQVTVLNGYLSSSGQKLDPKSLNGFQNTATDTSFAAAAQNNTLPSVYKSYVISSLKNYQTTLNEEYKKTSSAKLKSLLADDYSSIQTLLSSPDLK